MPDPLSSMKFAYDILGKLFQPLWQLVQRHLMTQGAEREKINNLLGYDPKELERVYIEPDCQDVPPAGNRTDDEKISKEPLLDVIDRFLRERGHDGVNKYFIILSDAGMGKSALLAMLKLRHLKGSWHRGRKCELEKLGPQTLEKIGKIDNERKTILLLDSLDEDPKSFGRVKARLADILRASEPFAKVIITCRSQFLPELGKDPMNDSECVIADAYHCLCKHLSFFNSEKVGRFLAKRFPKRFLGLGEDQQKKIDKAKEIIQLMGHLSCRPLLLSYIEDLMKSESMIKSGNEYSLYHALVTNWLMREKRKNEKIIVNKLYTACVILAVWMQIHKRYAISERELDELKKTEIARVGSVRQIKQLDMQGRSLLNRNVDGDYRFAHFSLQEFCAAKYICEAQPFELEGKIRVTDQIVKLVVDSEMLNPELDPSVIDLNQIDDAAIRQEKIMRQGMEFVFIPPGAFYMGSPEDETGRGQNESRHLVLLTRGFHMQTTPVTQAQWEAVMGENPSGFKGEGDRPVENVSWDLVQGFIRKLNVKAGGDLFTLSTEAQWEYACRAGTETTFYTGDTEADLDRAGWYDKNSKEQTHPVAQKEANRFGLYDMHGNVREWCQDWFGGYPKGVAVDPRGPSNGSYRVFRGGSWSLHAELCRTAIRSRNDPDTRGGHLGFRLVRLPAQ